MPYKYVLLRVGVISAICVLSGCTKPPSTSGNCDLISNCKTQIGNPEPPPPPPPPSEKVVFSVKVSSLYEQHFTPPSSQSGSNSETVGGFPGDSPASAMVHKTCTFTDKTLPASVDAQGICDVEIPEGRNEHAYLFFEVKAPEGICDIVFFHPYFYRVSESNAFSPPWLNDPSRTVNCSEYPYPTDCFDGAGVKTIGNPNRFDRVVMMFDKRPVSYWFLAEPARMNGRWFNLFTNNNLSAALRSAPTASLLSNLAEEGYGFVPNSMNDWRMTCVDPYEDLQYSWLIIIHSRVGNTTQRLSWPDFY